MQFDNLKNGAISAPGLAIDASTAYAKYANTFKVKANSRISADITTLQAPSLLNAPVIAPYPSGVTVKAGTLATGYYRVYALICTLAVNGTGTVTPTFSWLASADYLSSADLPNSGNFPIPDQSNQAVVGWLLCLNASGSVFTPGTTALSSITTSYIDNTVGMF